MYSSKCICSLAVSALAAAAFAMAARGATYDETIQGDLSGVPASPTPWALTVGANTLIGSAGNTYSAAAGDVADYDLVTFTVPAGNKLASIIINSVATTSGDSAFFALQEGSPWLDGVGYEMAGINLISYALAGSFDAGADLLLNINGGPLDAGVYTFECQDVDAPFSYSLGFNVAPVPEPSSVLLALGAGCLGMTATRRLRRQRATK